MPARPHRPRGFELARAVLSLRPAIPVLMTSGNIGAEDERLARIDAEKSERDQRIAPLAFADLVLTVEQLFL